jgi:mono/diheme cytochrome c family protein
VKHTRDVTILTLALWTIMVSTAIVAHAADVEQGKKLYMQFCATCHGQSGKGDGPAAAALNPKPRDHTDKEYMSKLSDEDLFKVIQNGGASVGKSPLMPAWGASIKPDEIREIIAYVRTLSQ